jgi:hypothetical protein
VVFFANRRVEPSGDYTYDPLYRLIAAQGREHLGQTGSALNAAQQVTDDESFRTRLPQPGDGNAMGTYVESYDYDALGNILSMAHVVASGGWTRNYAYSEASRIVAVEPGNRLTATSLPGDPAGGPFSATYAHDAHGNMTKMPHLRAMVWSEDDRLRATTRTAGGAAPPTTYYAYDSAGERLRKVVENQTATRVSERIYLGNQELYREFAGDGTTIDLSRESLAVMAGEPAARIETRTLGNDPGPAQQIRYQFVNHLHSATLELGDNAEVISYEEYFPFGATSYQAVASLTDVAKRYRFDGRERDEENGLDCMGALLRAVAGALDGLRSGGHGRPGPISAAPGTARRSSTTRRAPTRPIRNKRRRHHLPSRPPRRWPHLRRQTTTGQTTRPTRPRLRRKTPASAIPPSSSPGPPRAESGPPSSPGRVSAPSVRRGAAGRVVFSIISAPSSLVASNWACRPASVAREAPDSR